jgi:hypothetical protein
VRYRRYSPYYWYGGRRLLRSAGLSAAAGAGRSLLALPACGAWDAATAMSFMAFVVYAVSCVLAGLDIKDGKGLVKPRGEQKRGCSFLLLNKTAMSSHRKRLYSATRQYVSKRLFGCMHPCRCLEFPAHMCAACANKPALCTATCKYQHLQNDS